jgi:nitrite reductase/ring-hydroxylating ferredoxin subunit/uncharacterized membrane protein
VRQSLGKFSKRLRAARNDRGEIAGSGSADDAKAPPARRASFPRLATFAERVERAPSLDGPVHALSDAIARVLKPGTRLDDVLHGVPFGQPAHPALVRLPLGCWTSAVLLDFLPAGTRLPGMGRLPLPGSPRSAGPASQALLATGLATSIPSAAAGLADWSALHRHQQRVGLVHAITQGGATILFGASLVARLSGQQRYGKALSLAGLATATGGAYLGGHLALRLGAGASHAESIEHLAALGWQDLCQLADLPDERPTRRQLGYLSLFVLRRGDVVHVLSDHCAHLGGPLHQGRVTSGPSRAGDARASEPCVTCPWHGSVFRVSDGSVVHGPATARQPTFESQVTSSGWVQVRPRSTGKRP